LGDGRVPLGTDQGPVGQGVQSGVGAVLEKLWRIDRQILYRVGHPACALLGSVAHPNYPFAGVADVISHLLDGLAGDTRDH